MADPHSDDHNPDRQVLNLRTPMESPLPWEPRRQSFKDSCAKVGLFAITVGSGSAVIGTHIFRDGNILAQFFAGDPQEVTAAGVAIVLFLLHRFLTKVDQSADSLESVRLALLALHSNQEQINRVIEGKEHVAEAQRAVLQQMIDHNKRLLASLATTRALKLRRRRKGGSPGPSSIGSNGQTHPVEQQAEAISIGDNSEYDIVTSGDHIAIRRKSKKP